MLPGHTKIPGLSDEECAASRQAFDRVGDRWSLYIVEQLMSGPVQFNELRRSVEGISQRMLTLTLRILERDGLISRTVYPTNPPAVEYALTQLGHTLLEPIQVLVKWASACQAQLKKRAKGSTGNTKSRQGKSKWDCGNATRPAKSFRGACCR